MKATEKQKAQQREYYQKNKARILEHNKLYNKEHKEHIRAQSVVSSKKYQLAHREEILARVKKWRREHREQVLATIKRWQQTHKQECNAYQKYYAGKVKKEVISFYSEGKNCCRRCSLNDMRALTIDHIKGGGNKHRRKLGKRNLYSWLRYNNYPEGYQVLCMSCQFIKRSEERECYTR